MITEFPKGPLYYSTRYKRPPQLFTAYYALTHPLNVFSILFESYIVRVCGCWGGGGGRALIINRGTQQFVFSNMAYFTERDVIYFAQHDHIITYKKQLNYVKDPLRPVPRVSDHYLDK